MTALHANLLLLVTAAVWGLGNVAQKTVLDHLDPMSAVGLRCLIGGALLLPFALRGLRLAPGYVLSLLRVGLPFALAMAVQQVAFGGTTATNAGFLVNTAAVLTPVVAWAMLGERPTRAILAAAGATLAGALLLSGGLAGGMARGDVAAVLSAAGFALWMVEMSRHLAVHRDPCAAAAAQFLLAALLTLPLGAAWGDLSWDGAAAAAPELAMLGAVVTAGAFGAQAVALRFTTSGHAAVILSAESAFGAVAAALVLGERMTPVQAVGAALVLGAILALARAATRAERAAERAAARA